MTSPESSLFFRLPLPKEAQSPKERSFFGYFDETGKRSVWTLCLDAEETENNHEIAKKLRKMKQSLDKAFSGFAQKDFTQTILTERFAFQEHGVYATGEVPHEYHRAHHMNGVLFLTDSYGVQSSLDQVGDLLGVKAIKSWSEGLSRGEIGVATDSTVGAQT